MINNNRNFKLLKDAFSKFPDRKLFCPLPFKHLEIMSGGETLLCCYIDKSPGILKNQNLIELYNSPDAQQIRQSILDGTFRYCNLEACPHFSAGSLPLQKDCIGSPYEGIITSQSPYLKTINIWLSFDKRCNLRCISCRDKLITYSKKENTEAENILQQVKSALPQISSIGLSGSGDPFASPLLRLFLSELDASLYPELKISILTNGLLLNKNTWDHLLYKSNTAIKSIQVSIDAATKRTYMNIRRGGSHETLLDNLHFISALRSRNIIGEFIISFVVNASNYKEMAEFVQLGMDLNCDQVYFSAMMDWQVLSERQYKALAVHLPENPCHQDFRNRIQDRIFDDPIVSLGNLHRFKPNRLLRDSLFS